MTAIRPYCLCGVQSLLLLDDPLHVSGIRGHYCCHSEETNGLGYVYVQHVFRIVSAGKKVADCIAVPDHVEDLSVKHSWL